MHFKDLSSFIIPSFGSGLSGVQFTQDGREIGPRHWGISKSQLLELCNKCKSSPLWDSSDTVRNFVEKFIKPMTNNKNMGVSLLYNQRVPKEVTLMVSHAWDENAEDFFSDVAEHMRDDEVAFICFLALHQGTEAEIQRQLGDDIEKGPFAEAIDNVSRLHGRLLVVPNEALKSNGQGLCSRLWCNWEIYCATQKQLPIYFTHRCTRKHLLGSSSLSSRDAYCGRPNELMNKDEIAIRAAIKALPMSLGNVVVKARFGVVACISLVVLVTTYGGGWEWQVAAIICSVLIAMLNFKLYLAVTDGYDLLDNVIEMAAVGGVPGSCSSFGTSTALTLLGVLNGIASVLSEIDEYSSSEHASLFFYLGLLLGVACMYPHRRLETTFTRKVTTIVIRVVTVVLLLAYIGIFLWIFHERLAAFSGEHVGLSIALGVTWHNRQWWQRMLIFILATVFPIISFLALSGSSSPWKVMWACSFTSTIGLVLGTTETGSGHTLCKRRVRSASIICGVIVGSFNFNACQFSFRRSPVLPKYWFLCPWLGALLGCEVGLDATMTVSRIPREQAAVVTIFAVCGIAGNILGQVEGGLVGCVVGHQLGTAVTIHAARRRRSIWISRQRERCENFEG